MSRFFKYFFYSCLGLLVSLILLWKLTSQELATYTSAKISKAAIANNVFLNFTQSNFGLFNFQSKLLTVDLANQRIPVNLELENLKISPVITSFLSGAPALDFSFKIHDGAVVGRIFKQGQGIGLKDFQIRNVNISRVSFLKLAGFSSGQINLDLEQLILQDNQAKVKTLKFELANFVKKDASVLPRWISGMPFDLNIEPLNLQKLTGTVELDSILKIKDLNLQSDWGDLLAELVLNMDPRGIKLTLASGNVELKEPGSKQLSPFLSLLSNRQLSSDQMKFTFQFLEYQDGFPKFTFKGY